MDGKMIEKVEVRRRLNTYKSTIKERMRIISSERNKMKDACSITEMENIWLSSKENAILTAKYEVLSEVIQDIFDMLDDFQDDEL